LTASFSATSGEIEEQSTKDKTRKDIKKEFSFIFAGIILPSFILIDVKNKS